MGSTFVTGLDWSGNPGDPRKTPHNSPYWVFAAVTIAIDQISLLKESLSNARAALRIDPDYTFKHIHASPRTHDVVFNAIARVPLCIHVLIIDKRNARVAGQDRIPGRDLTGIAIIELVKEMPDYLVAGQLLYLDLPRQEKRLVMDYRTAIRRALRESGQTSYADVKPRPDDRDDSATVQVADMIAGEIAEHGGLGGIYLPRLLAARIHLSRR
jgi:hypothetical protein